MHNVTETKSIVVLDPFFERKEDRRSAIREVEDLCEICNYEIVGMSSFFVRNRSGSLLLSKGIAERTKIFIDEHDPDILVFNCVLTGSQKNNISKYFDKRFKVIDRQQIIIEVFSRRANSSIAKLQVKLAILRYEKTDLIDVDSHFDQQKKSAITRGLGEKKIELDRRKIKEQIQRINHQLKDLEVVFSVKKKKRTIQNKITFALVGYTNAGKSSIMKNFAEEDILVDEKVFATLDTLTRKISSSDNKSEFLLTDTIGFIQDIPASLLDAFKSTIQESVDADFLLLVLDANDEKCFYKMKFMIDILQDIGIEIKEDKVILILNKSDLSEHEDAEKCIALADKMDMSSIRCSAINKDNFDSLMNEMRSFMSKKCINYELNIACDRFFEVKNFVINNNGMLYSVAYDENINQYKVSLSLPKEKLDILINMLSSI
ncbi:MAG: GTPase HflX [Chlamydiia bacterium]|nr:GTPase HflX [Chlamydiia bacterium]